MDICQTYHVLISTSLDGPEWLHNRNRGKKDSYEKVVAGITKARELLGYDQVSALMTASEEGVLHPNEIVDEYDRLGFNSIFLRALNPYGLARDNSDWDVYTDKFIDFYKKALNHIIELNLNGKFFIEEFAAIILRKMLTPFCTGFVDLQSPAGIINSVLVYNYDGYVYRMSHVCWQNSMITLSAWEVWMTNMKILSMVRRQENWERFGVTRR